MSVLVLQMQLAKAFIDSADILLSLRRKVVQSNSRERNANMTRNKLIVKTLIKGFKLKH